jgi:hypothetical protein
MVRKESVKKSERRAASGGLALRGAIQPLYALVVSVILAECGRAKAASPEGAARPIAEFEIERAGAPFTLPVTLGGKPYPFVLDTGAALWLFDGSLKQHLGSPRPIRAVNILGKPGTVTVRIAQNVSLGPLSLGSAAGPLRDDARSFWLRVGLDAYGLIGMESLRDKVLSINFDEGRVSFLQRATGDLGTPVPLTWKGVVPYAVVEIEGLGAEEVLIDTGNMGYYTGSLRPPSFDKVLASGKSRRIPLFIRGAGLDVPSATRCSQVRSLTLGPFRHNDLIVSDAMPSQLGLAYLARYIVTFDFPNSTMYLRRGKNFQRPDRCDLSGLNILPQDGKAVVRSVYLGGPAETAGIREGDEIVSVDGMLARDMTNFGLCRLFAEPGVKRVVLLRDGKELRKYVSLLDLDTWARAEQELESWQAKRLANGGK